MTPRSLTLLPALALVAAACAPYPVEGDFAGRPLNGHEDPGRTIVLIHNHGFSRAHAGTYRPVTPPILRLAGESCGGWGSLYAAAFTYPTIGGVLAFAPTCHGKLPHPPEVRARRAWELVRLAERLRAQGTIFLYDGDSYYDVAEWDGFATRTAGRAPWLRIVRVSRPRVLELCDFCGRDSHGAYWDGRFAAAFFDDHVQTLIDGIRARIRARLAASAH